MNRIVVGVDGSEHSLGALRFALVEARLRGARVVAVHVPHLPLAPVVGAPAFVIGDLPELVQSVEESAAALIDDALAKLASEAEGVEVEKVVARGGVAHELLKAAEGAEMLVLGSRGHGGFMGLLLGSVSHQCAHHAPCPVVIVPRAEHEATA
jgi:nucleotide-binding universal stress UspA family protein